MNTEIEAAPALRLDQTPALSVVVTIVEGGTALPRVLAALLRQEHPPTMEILVPIDATVPGLSDLQLQFPTVHFLALGHLQTTRPPSTAGGQHELYDRRRAAGLSAATGSIVAILEDRGLPRPEWASTALRLHQQPWAVIGGAIEPAPSRLIDWALYICDFSRYALPLPGGPSEWICDINVSYKRRALEQTAPIWGERFHEPSVHWELRRRGEELFLSPDLVVDYYRTPKPLGWLLAERFHWGRLFGHIRANAVGGPQRVIYVLGSPFIPLLLLFRHAIVHGRRGEAFRFIVAIPVLLCFLTTWTAGEVVGTLTRKP